MSSSKNRQIIQQYTCGNLILKGSKELNIGPLILGDCNSAMDKKVHAEYSIQTVISIGQEAMPIKQKLPENCQHYFYDIHDNKSQKVPAELFDEINSKIDKARENCNGVLVHCYAGVSRSSSFVIAYVMWKEGIGYWEAKQRVKKQRNCICPNDGFVNHLKVYEKVLQKREEQRKRLEEQQRERRKNESLVRSARKSVRGGVRAATVEVKEEGNIDQGLKNKLQQNKQQSNLKVIVDQEEEKQEKPQQVRSNSTKKLQKTSIDKNQLQKKDTAINAGNNLNKKGIQITPSKKKAGLLIKPNVESTKSKKVDIPPKVQVLKSDKAHKNEPFIQDQPSKKYSIKGQINGKSSGSTEQKQQKVSIKSTEQKQQKVSIKSKIKSQVQEQKKQMKIEEVLKKSEAQSMNPNTKAVSQSDKKDSKVQRIYGNKLKVK